MNWYRVQMEGESLKTYAAPFLLVVLVFTVLFAAVFQLGVPLHVGLMLAVGWSLLSGLVLILLLERVLGKLSLRLTYGAWFCCSITVFVCCVVLSALIALNGVFPAGP